MDASGMSVAAISALRTLKLPPFVHPQTLAAAAAHCIEFGGNEEMLNAAVFAGGIIQAHMLHAVKANASMPPMAGGTVMSSMQLGSPLQGSWPLHAPPIPLAVPPGPADARLSEQAKQAMAAAQATNESLREKEERQHSDSARQGFVPVEPLAMPLPMGTMGQNMPFMPPMMMPPPLLMPVIPQPVAAPPVATTVPPRQPPARQPAAREPAKPVRDAPPEREAPKPAKAAKEEKREDRREDAKDEKGASAPDELADPMRCHLHRKPQLNCKICRRLYYSALDPGAQKKEERSKDKAASDRVRREHEDDAFSVRRRAPEAFEITNKQTFNFNSMLRDQILKNTYFKSLMNIETFEGIVDEMYQYAETAEVYGAGTTTVPSTLFCCLFRLFTLGLSYDELQQLLETRDWPYIRCCGFLYIRFGCAPEKLWDQLGDYCLDDQEFEPSKLQPNFQVTIGEYVEALLMDERYYYTALPRIPVGVKKKIEEQVAPLMQYRRRTQANKRCLHLFREPGTPIEASNTNCEWVPGTIVQLVETYPTRIMVRVRLDDGPEELQHLGKVILLDRRGARGRSRSRSRGRMARDSSPDWTRHRGKSQAEMVQELRARQRERAVCSSGKDYARKPIGFMSGLALKRDIGVASTRLREEETYAPRQVEHRKQMTEEEEMERRKEEREKLFQDHEKRQLMQQIYEKYGMTHPPPKPKEPEDQPALILL